MIDIKPIRAAAEAVGKLGATGMDDLQFDVQCGPDRIIAMCDEIERMRTKNAEQLALLKAVADAEFFLGAWKPTYEVVANRIREHIKTSAREST